MMKGGVYGLLVVLVVVAQVHATAAVTCDPSEVITACAPAYSSGGAPSSECCSKLKEQLPCFCEYLKNPIYGPYINSPNARRIAAACGGSYPKCS